MVATGLPPEWESERVLSVCVAVASWEGTGEDLKTQAKNLVGLCGTVGLQGLMGSGAKAKVGVAAGGAEALRAKLDVEAAWEGEVRWGLNKGAEARAELWEDEERGTDMRRLLFF